MKLELNLFENIGYADLVSGTAHDIVDELLTGIHQDLEYNNVSPNDFYWDDEVHEWLDNLFIGATLADHICILENAKYLEDDNGLWESLEPIDAVKCQAFFTMRNDVSDEVRDSLIKLLDEGIEEMEDKMAELEDNEEEKADDLQDKINQLQALVNNL